MSNSEEKTIHNSSRTSREFQTMIELEESLKVYTCDSPVRAEIVKIINSLRTV